MTKVHSHRLRDMFRNNDFAWDVLEQQMILETSGNNIDGEDIARLLALYMKGVQTLNSMRDPREFFFRNRLNNLMMKPLVVQVLNQGNKPKEQTKQQSKAVILESPEHKLKKTQLEMRVTYAQQQHNLQNMKKVLVQHQSKANIYANTVGSVVTQGRNRLEERLNQRKLKAVTARQRSVQTNQEKPFKPQVNTFQTLGQIKQQSEYHPQPKRRHRSQSLDLKALSNNESSMQVAYNKGMSLLIPSVSRKQSQQLQQIHDS